MVAVGPVHIHALSRANALLSALVTHQGCWAARVSLSFTFDLQNCYHKRGYFLHSSMYFGTYFKGNFKLNLSAKTEEILMCVCVLYRDIYTYI